MHFGVREKPGCNDNLDNDNGNGNDLFKGQRFAVRVLTIF